MRLICPNCAAQYDVDDDVVPEGGRDVQCSNCGHTWFQRPATKDHELADETGHHESAAPQEPEAPEPEPEYSPPPQANEAEADSSDQSQPQQRDLEAGVADILRQEAERETAERLAEGSNIESQPDLGLGDSAEDTAAAKERMARMRGLGDDDLGATTAATATAARKDLLPDIEEINSTLTASSDRNGDETADEFEGKRKRSGFRRGFSLVALIFAVMALVYVYAPNLVEKAPSIEPMMTAYVEWVNTLRVSVDGLMQTAVEKLTALLSQVGGDSGEG